MNLFPFQEDGIDFLRTVKRGILADDPGMGKTPQAVIAAQGHRRILVAVPSNLRTQWASKIHAWTGEEVAVLRGPKDASQVTSTTKWLITNHEVAKVHKIDRTTKEKIPWKESGLVVPSIELGKTIFRFNPDCVIVDEAHLMVNPKHSWTRGMKILMKNAISVYELTGTPFANEVLDLWTLLNLVQPDKFSAKWKFLKEHANARPGVHGWEYTKFATDPIKLGNQIKPYILRRTSQLMRDMGLLPPAPLVEEIYLDATDEQRQFFKDVDNDQVAEINGEFLVAPSQIVRMTRFRQASVDMRLIGGGMGRKIPSMIERVNSTDRRVIVFSCFAEAIELAHGDLKAIPHVVYTGKTPEKVRDSLVQDFQDPASKTKVFLATTEAGGPGLDLFAGSMVIFLDRHYSPVKNKQAIARADRYGQGEQVLVVNFRTKDSIDDHVYDINDHKEQNAAAILSVVERK